MGSERVRRTAEETRALILEAAAPEFAAHGFAGARLEHVAERVGVKQALIHHYFAGKEGLYQAVVEHALDKVQAQGLDLLARPLEGDRASATDLVIAFVDLLLHFQDEHRSLYALLRHEAHARAVAPQEPRRKPKFVRAKTTRLALDLVELRIRPVFEVAVQRLEAWRKVGVISQDVDAASFCLALVSMTSFLAQEGALAGALVPDTDPRVLARQHRETIVHLCLSGLGLEATPTRRATSPPTSTRRRASRG